MRVTAIAGYRELLERGLLTNPSVERPAEAVSELEERVADPDCALFVEDGGFLIAENNRSEFVNACMIIHFYCERPGVLRALLEQCIEFATAGGLARFYGVDINNLTERGYRLLLCGMPRELRRLGAAYHVKV